MNKVKIRGRVISIFIYALTGVFFILFGLLERKGNVILFQGSILAWIVVFILLLLTIPKNIHVKVYGTLQTFAIIMMDILTLAYFQNENLFFMMLMLQWVLSVMLCNYDYLRFLTMVQGITLLIVDFVPLFFGEAMSFSFVELFIYCIFVIVAHWITRNVIKSFVTVYDEVEEQKMSMNDLLKLLKEKNDQAQKATRSKTIFLSNMSHEIRTPINSILGMNELILRRSKEKETIENSIVIKSAGEMLLALINDILDFSKIESGKMELVNERYDLSSTINDIYSVFSIRMQEKGLAFNVKINPNLPSGLVGDVVRLREIMINLLTNALKYTDEGEVTLYIGGAMDESKQKVMLQVAVEDTGIGIAKEDLEKLNESFVRFNLERNNNVEGTGLGISIVTGFLKLMDSSLQVESKVGEGSRFSFEVEQEVYNASIIGDFDVRVHISEQRKEYTTSFVCPNANILVVDDNLANLKVFEGLLREIQCKIDAVDSGQKAIRYASEKKYDIIFMDHMMPGMDGIETMHKIKEECEINQNTPVFVLTANAVSGAQKEYLAEGFNGYLTKPIVSRKLEKVVKENIDPGLLEKPVLEGSSLEETNHENKDDHISYDKQASKTTIFDENELPVIEGLDWKYAFMHVPDKDLLFTILSEYTSSLKKTIKTVEKLYNNIDENKNDEDINLYRIQVHGLKSTSAMIGLIPLAGISATLEYAARDGKIDMILDTTPHFLEECKRYYVEMAKYFETASQEIMKEWKKEDIFSILDDLLEDTRTYNVVGMDGAIDLLQRYDFKDEMKELVEKLGLAVENLEGDDVKVIVSEMKNIL